jgi:hypothetical protein
MKLSHALTLLATGASLFTLARTAHALELYGGAAGIKTTLSGACGGTGAGGFSGSCDDGSSATMSLPATRTPPGKPT